MTYEEFLTDCREKQIRHLANQRWRLAKAAQLHDRYAASMQVLGLHPLTGLEIRNWQRDLKDSRAAVDAEYADGPAMRAAYEARQAQEEG